MRSVGKAFSVVFLVILLITAAGLSSCGRRTKSIQETYGLPDYEGASYEFVDDNEYKILKITWEDFSDYVGLLKQAGFTFKSVSGESEEDLMNFDLWNGEKDGITVSVFFMYDMKTGSNYIQVGKSES